MNMPASTAGKCQPDLAHAVGRGPMSGQLRLMNYPHFYLITCADLTGSIPRGSGIGSISHRALAAPMRADAPFGILVDTVGAGSRGWRASVPDFPGMGCPSLVIIP